MSTGLAWENIWNIMIKTEDEDKNIFTLSSSPIILFQSLGEIDNEEIKINVLTKRLMGSWKELINWPKTSSDIPSS